jgi:stage IV sporulation protein FB
MNQRRAPADSSLPFARRARRQLSSAIRAARVTSMFGPLRTTPYDLRFPLFGIPVHVTPWFWVAAVIMGWNLASSSQFDLLLIWIACVFVSILIHELGHATCARSFGWPPEIFLYEFGGLAVFRPGYGATTTRSVIVSLAGPAAGFLLYGLVYFAAQAVASSGWYGNLDHEGRVRVSFFFIQMEWINLWWGLVNLLPVIPLDGGRVAESILTRLRYRDGRELAMKLSIAVAAGVALYFWHIDQRYGAILFGLLCLTNIMALQPRNPC